MPAHRTKMNRFFSPASDSSSPAPEITGMNSKFFGSDAAPNSKNLKRSKEKVLLDNSMYIIPKVELEYSPEKSTIYFPATTQERQSFRTNDGKKVTTHQWAVYDFARTIPRGKVTTYKEVASAVGGSPRSVGSALRHNPFSPYVPCHRVIASNLFIGGFFGEWGKDHKTGLRYNDKVAILSGEGVQFDEKGNLLSAGNALWRP